MKWEGKAARLLGAWTEVSGRELRERRERGEMTIRDTKCAQKVEWERADSIFFTQDWTTRRSKTRYLVSSRHHNSCVKSRGLPRLYSFHLDASVSEQGVWYFAGQIGGEDTNVYIFVRLSSLKEFEKRNKTLQAAQI